MVDVAPSKLFLIATPIGNLSDLSHRAIEVLNRCDLIACEDTRVTAKLLSNFSIRKKLLSYREENERKQTEVIAEQISQGANVALLSDAGYPGISDPGFRLVRECHRTGIKVIPIPGPNAALTALSASGLPTHQFLFLGFLPKKTTGITKIFEKWQEFEGSIIFFESRHKIVKTLALMEEFFEADRHICIARELTKLHESIISGPISEAILRFNQESKKGEFTLVLAPKGYSIS